MKVLEDAHTENVDNFIFLGDYYMDFPFANEIVAELMRMENAYFTYIRKIAGSHTER